jgi:Mn2+/Fe2+ NRAMP family transporter
MAELSTVKLSLAPKAVEQEGLLAKLGPGLVTGAADDDPSGIATYSRAALAYGKYF